MDLDQRVRSLEFSMYGKEDEPLLQGVTKLQYIRRILKHMENDWPEVHRNIVKGREVWQILANIL